MTDPSPYIDATAFTAAANRVSELEHDRSESFLLLAIALQNEDHDGVQKALAAYRTIITNLLTAWVMRHAAEVDLFARLTLRQGYNEELLKGLQAEATQISGYDARICLLEAKVAKLIDGE